MSDGVGKPQTDAATYSPAGRSRLFLSYARGDDEPFVRRLYDDLRAYSFKVWFDRVSLPSRRLTFHQEIKDAIRRDTDRILLVVGPKAANSDYVREEWQFALALDRTVVPILRVGDFDLIPGTLSLVNCEDFRRDEDYPTALAKLISNLELPDPPLGALSAVPSLPEHFLARRHLMQRVKDALLVDLQRPVVTIGASSRVGVQGMGGIGKSVLAAAVARDREVRRAFPDGVLWVSVGKEPSLVDILRDLALALGFDEDSGGVIDREAKARRALRVVLHDKAILLVVDDVWDAAHADAFDFLGPRSRALVTTRDAGVLRTVGGVLHPVSLFDEAQSLQYVADATGTTCGELPEAARQVVRKCGFLPLALALCAGMARKREGTWDHVLRRLERTDLDRIRDRHAINPDHESIWRAMQVSVDALDDGTRARFAELSVFSTDRRVPEAAVATLWAHTDALDDLDTEELLIELFERSLIRIESTEAGSEGQPRRHVSLHDLLHDYACKLSAGPEEMHGTLLEAYHARCPAGWAGGPNDGYFFQELLQHLSLAGRSAEARGLLTSYPWLAAKLAVLPIGDMLRDYSLLMSPGDKTLARIHDALRLSGHVIAASPGQLAAQVIGRLGAVRTGEISALVAETRECASLPCLLPSWPRYTSPGQGLLYTLDGEHNFATLSADGSTIASWRPGKPMVRFWDSRTGELLVKRQFPDPVYSVALNADGQRYYCASGRTIIVADLQEKETWSPLRGHALRITSLALSSDEFTLASGSRDRKIMVWDVVSGTRLHDLNACSEDVVSLALSADGRIMASGSWDTSIKIWDTHSGKMTHTVFEDNSPDCTNTVALSADGQTLISGSPEGAVKIRSAKSGALLGKSMGHSGFIAAVALSRDGGTIVSGGKDGNIVVWNALTGEHARTLVGHSGGITSVALSANGNTLVSGASDNTVRVWSVDAGAPENDQVRHAEAVIALALSDDGQTLVSGSSDKEIRCWDAKSGGLLGTYVSHSDVIRSPKLCADGLAAVCRFYANSIVPSRHGVKLWDLRADAFARELIGKYGISNSSSLAISRNGRTMASGKRWEPAIRVWDAQTGELVRNFEVQAIGVDVLGMCTDGRILAGGLRDNTVKVWDTRTGEELATLVGHHGAIVSVMVSPDGKVVYTGSCDRTVKAWWVQNGQCLRDLAQHTQVSRTFAISADGRFLVGGSTDRTVRVWDMWAAGDQIAQVVIEAAVEVVEVSPCGRFVWAGDTGGRVYRFDLRM